MAKVGDNIVTTGLRGKLGNLIVFRNYGGKTIVSMAPKRKKTQRTETQEKYLQRFKEAVLYAQNAIADKVTKDAYQNSAQEGRSAYNVAVADFLNAPRINEIDVSHYNGRPGSYLQIHAIDDFMVKDVSVTIRNADGTEIENGMAIQQPGAIWWRYTATTVNPSLNGSIIIVRVSDLPGNLTGKITEL
ncbi:MAG: hypothetical protein QM786_05215 [Breznakibacter sp.]